MGEYVKQNLDPNDWSGLSDEGRKLLYNTMMRHGDVPAEKDGALTEFGQAFMGAGIDTLRGVGSTLEEMYGVSGMKDYFDRVKRNNRQYDPYEGYKALSLDPANIARTIGSGAAQSALALGGAVAGGILGGGVGGVAASTGIMFGQIYGDRVQEYRDAFPNQDDKTVRGLAFLSSLGESLIESVVGPEQLAAGIAKKWATGALKETTKGFVKSVGKEAVKNFLTEGSEEVAQDFWDRLCRSALEEEGLQLPSWEEVGETFMGGAWSGLALGAAGGAVESIGSRGGVTPAAPVETPAAPVEAANENHYNPESERATKLTLAEQVAKELGINVRYVDEMKEEDKTDVDKNSEAISDGWYDEKTGEIWLDRNNPNSDVLKNLGHEFKHFLDDKQKGLIQRFNDLFNAGINEAGNARAAELEDAYQKRAGQVGRGFDELSADTFGEMWTDPDFWRDVATRAEKMETGMGQKFIDTLNEFIKIVKAKLKQIGTPEAKQLFDNMNELRDEAVNILAEIKRQNGTSTEEENVVGVNGSTTVESVPVSEIKLDPERFQFKSNTNKKTGVDESNRIGGEWDPKSAGILYLWEDKDGNKFVVNGHHRLDLAKRKNVENLNAIIDREADGVSAEDARKNGILINIRDEQGEVRDYADFVRSSKLDEATADKEGVTSRRKGKTGFTIGHYASDNLYATYRNEDITDAQAAAIADIARGDTGLENAGIRAAKNGMKKVQLVEHLKFLKANGDLRQKNEETGDLFGGFDDSALKLSEELSAKALEHIDGLKKLINSAKSAIKNPAEAKKLGVSVGKEAQNLLDRTRQELQDWENWQTNKKLRDQLLKEIKKTMPETEAAPKEKARPRSDEEKNNAVARGYQKERDAVSEFPPDKQQILKGKWNRHKDEFTSLKKGDEFVDEDGNVVYTVINADSNGITLRGEENAAAPLVRIPHGTMPANEYSITTMLEDGGLRIKKANEGRFNPDSETPLLTPEEDANDFTLFDQTPEESKADEKAAEQKEDEERERADQQSKRETPELDFGEQKTEEKPKKLPPVSESGRLNAESIKEVGKAPNDVQWNVDKDGKPKVYRSENRWSKAQAGIRGNDAYIRLQGKGEVARIFEIKNFRDKTIMQIQQEIESAAEDGRESTYPLGKNFDDALQSLHDYGMRVGSVVPITRPATTTTAKPTSNFLDDHIIVTGVPKPANTQAVANTRPSDEEMRKELHDVIMSDGDARSKATQLSRLAKAWNMSLKEVQERCEEEVVEIAREIDSLYYMDDARKYKNIVSLYNNQPNFSNRTNTSKINQAYSTPAPLAWLLGKRIGLKGNTVYEPTAGTGMLTVAGDPSTIHVNEINPLRSEILNRQGFMLNTSNDASKTRPNKKYDRVIMNPPFGEGATGTFEGFKLTKLDHVIAARALEAMKPDGRAAIIVGANTEGHNGEGRETVADHIFMNYLYSNFNVKDNFIVSGDMYTKQGASYPVRVITIEGKRAEKITPNHPKNIEKIDNWDTLYNRLQGELGNGTENNTENISEPGRSDNGSELVERPRPVSDKEGGTAADEGRVRDEGTESSPQNRDESKSGTESVRGNGSERQDGGTGRLGENRPEQEAGGVSPNSEPGNDDSGSVRGDSSGVRGNNPELEQGNTNGSGENGGRSESSEPGGSGGQHGGQPVRNDVRPGQVRVSEPSSSWGANNTVVSTDAYEEAKKRMKDRLRRTNVGFDPGILSDGAIMAAYHIEAGARRFADFAKRMIDDLGDAIKPYLKMLYKSARDFPGMENIAKEMDSTDYVDKYNLDDLSKPETKKSEKTETKNQEQKREENAPEQVETGEKLNDLNNKYVPASRGRNMNLVVPGFLAKETEEALNDLQKEVGDVDEFVTKELGFSSVDELYECLDDAQIDSVAMAINAIKKGTGFIIGDQTGIGKGRQCAAIMRWAKEHGRIPILFTADPKLFSDSYCNDCPDLHMSISPIVLGDDDRAKIIDSNNNTLRRPIPNRKKMDAAFDSLIKGDGEYDSVYLTYSQINRTDNAQQQHLRRLIASNKCVLILDESHMAAGSVENQRGKQGISSKSGAFFFGDHGVLFNKNVDVVYSSATFAKRPDVMPLYAAKTRLKDAARNFGEVIDAFKKGGVALQQIVSKAMARSGQYIRRERDFDGVKFESSIDSTNKEDVEERYDRVAYVLLELVKYSRVIKAAVDDIVKPDHGTSNAQEDVRVQTSSFGSVAHNYIAQLLLGSKSDIIVDNAAKAIEAGQKPVIVVNNTMGSALDTYAAENDLANGDPVTMRFADILESALMRMYTYTIPNPTGDGTIKVSFSPEDFGLGAEHEAMLSMIRELRDINLPISPIDYIKNRLAKKGIKMSELTGRERSVDYSSGTPVLAARSSKDRNKNINTNNFNSGATDGIILNQAGATGISLHSSEKYKDQRQRKMIIGQPSLDIAVVMQVLGRVLRTGQVNLPEYLILSSALSPERRVLMVLNKKLQSLNANTTANNKGAIDLGVDFLNKYGDAVVKEYVKDHPEITALLGLNITDDTQDAITKFTGKISLLPNSQQEDIYNDITDRYLILVDYLKQTGNYDLEVTVHDDWDVQTESSEELVGGNKNGVMFDQPVTRKQITIRERKKIRSADEVRGEMDKNVGRDEEEVKQKLDHRFRNVQKDIDNLMSMYQGENRKTEWIAARKALLQANYNNFRSFIEANANKVIEFKLGNDEYTGVISGYRTTGKYVPKSPFIPSATIVEFAVSDTVGKISIPFSKIIVADPSSGIFQYSDSTIPFDDVFTGKEYTTRVPRVAITGNLIKGINIAGGGKVVSYQTHDGNIEDALLLPKNSEAITKDPRREIKTADDVLAILENAGVLAAYEGATIRRNAWGGYQVAIPNSDRKGKDSKFKSDKGLEKIVLMTKVGSEWRTNWIDKDTAKRVVDYMMQNGTTFLRSQGMDESGRRYHLSEPVGAVSETDSEDTISAEANSRHFHLVEDPKLIKKLDNEDYITTYRTVQIIDKKLYPPMAAKIDGKLDNEIVIGKWEEAVERPDLAVPDIDKKTGKQKLYGVPTDEGYGQPKYVFNLDKGSLDADGNKQSDVDAAYNPYIHSSTTPLNDQFSTAFKRDNLVTIELHIPKSELTSGYHAEKAKNSVGMKQWKAGVVQGKLTGTREVMLSRWAKPVRIVPDSEVAKMIYDMVRGQVNDLPSNVLSPSLRAEIEKLGIPIAEMERRGKNYYRKGTNRKYHLPTQVNPIREDGEIKDEYAEFLEDSEYTPKTNAELNRQAERRIAGFGGVQGVIDAVLDDDFKLNSDISQRMMQVVLNSGEFKVLDQTKRRKVADLYIKNLGTEVGRALAARRLGVLNMDDIESIQAHVNALLAKMDKETIDKLRKDVFDEFGIDIDKLPDDIVKDPRKLDEVLRKLVAQRASIPDKLYEYWINAILSSPTTHAANAIGNTANAAYELGLKRLAEATINIFMRKKDAATFGEFKEMTNAVNWGEALRRAKFMFDVETLTGSGKLDRANAAIGGKLGRAIRVPGRLLRAADEFAKAVVQPMEAAAYAYRQAKAAGMNMEAARGFILSELEDEESDANAYGRKRALDLTFQEKPYQAIQQLISWRESGGVMGTMMKFFLPFIKTPSNILRQGIRKSPLGTANLAWQTVQGIRGKRQFDNEYVQLFAEQILAWGLVMALAGMGGDDDDKPFITGSSPRYGSAEQKFKANKLPPYSIRIGDNYYSYQRIEPLATGLAFIADGIEAYKAAKRGDEGTAIMRRLIGKSSRLVAEKSFLDSVGEIQKIADDPERGLTKWGTNFISSWMPNAVRTVRNNIMDDAIRDNKNRERGKKWFEEQFNVITSAAGITKAAPKRDYFGRIISRDSLSDAGGLWQWMRMVPIRSISPDENMNKAERLIWTYNQKNPDKEYYPDVPAYYFTRDGEKLYMTGKNYDEFVEKSGQLALKQINNAFRHGLLNERKPTEKDIDLIKNIFQRARKEVRDDFYKRKKFTR